VGGGAAALAGANVASEKVSGKGVGNETIRAGKQGTNYTRDQIAAAIDPNRKVTLKKNYVLIRKAKRRDNAERAAAGAVGATAGGLAMPVRDKIGKVPKQFAEKYKDVPEGTHHMSMPSSDLQTIAAPGVREKSRPWRDKKTNIKYTTRMAADIHRGKTIGSGEKPRVAIYDDAARVTGGQHRVQANAWSGMKDQDVEVVRMKGYYGGTERGHKAIRSRLKRRVYPKMFIKANPKDTADLLARDAKIANDDPALLHARKGATDTARVKIHEPFTKGDLHKLKVKQGAFLAGGAGAAVGARELYRRNQ
jgi:hypothetical protein